MKTTVFFIFSFLIVFSQHAYTQSRSYKMYDFFNGQDGVNEFSFSKNMKDAFDINLGKDDERKVTGDLHQIRLLIYNPQNGNFSGTEFTQKAISMLPRSYKKYHDTEDNIENAEIWLLGKRKKYRECHLFFDNNQPDGRRFIVSFYGDFTVSDLSRLRETGKKMAQSD